MRMPTLFVSHGAPTFALEPGRAGQLLRELGRRLPRPAGVVVVSPHWMTPTTRVMHAVAPHTLHDFNGFGPALETLRYPAAGSPALATRAEALLAASGITSTPDATRGFDHGAWVPLLHLYPEADVPVIQLSLPAMTTTADAWHLGTALAPLRDEGVLIVGSGSLTHNLYEVFGGTTVDGRYAAEFVAWTREPAALLHIENRTRFPNFGEAFGAFNAKRRWLAPALAERLGVRHGFESVTHVLVALWTSEVLHEVRMHPSSFRAICPDGPAAFRAWMEGDRIPPVVTSTFVLLDPVPGGRSHRRPWVDLEAALRVRPRYAGYAEALAALRAQGLA